MTSKAAFAAPQGKFRHLLPVKRERRAEGADSPEGEIVGCPDCGKIQTLPARPGGGALRCVRCATVLEQMNGRNLDGALACALTTFLLLFPANLLPILQVSILSHVNRSIVLSGVEGIWRQGWPFAAVVVGLEIVVLPFLRFGLLTLVLGTLRLGYHAPWLGPCFRWAERLDQWAMMDVFLFGSIVGYSRVAPFLPIHIKAGGYCLIAAALLTLITRATLERRDLWRRIGPLPRGIVPKMISCSSCDYPVPATQEGSACPRCGDKIHRIHPYSAMRAMALTVAAFAFYPEAYLYPMEYSDRLDTLHGYSIMTGVAKLVQANLYFFAAVVFVASILIPLLKLFAFVWFGVSIHRGSTSRLRLKTKLFRVIDLIGRWSHIDVFTVAVFLPLMYLPGFLSVLVGNALPAFLAVVVLTMLASDFFDPRLLWQAGQER
ncbi:MAG: paraquat-inducible protein A [Rhodospirillales bacterium 20-64-7]|nr:MAG: paraquat-inducible protein A [Rhodospirillales bacterium 20-64-7]